jgi:LPS export ABC transporter protein LptC
MIKRLMRMLLLSAIVLFISCPSNNKPANSETLPSQIITDFKLFESTSGLKLYSLTAEKAFVYTDAQVITVINPHVIFYNDDGTVSSVLLSLKGRVNTKTSDLFAQESVVVRTSDSTILYTDSLIWNNSSEKITTDAWIKIDSKQGLIEGQGLVSDASLKKIEIISSVTGKSKYEF